MNRRAVRAVCALLCFLFAQVTWATVLRVGPAGDYAAIQPAINAALATPGVYEIRIHVGVYTESLYIPASMVSGSLTLRGGYADGYLIQVRDGAIDTIVSPAINQVGGTIVPAGGSVTLAQLNFYGAQANSSGVGLAIGPKGSAQVVVDRCFFIENVSQTANKDASGGGINAFAYDNSSITLSNSDLHGNRAIVASGTGGASGAALYASAIGSAHLAIVGNHFYDNTLEARGALASGGAIHLNLENSATAQIDGNVIEAGPTGTLATAIQGRSLWAFVIDSASLTARGNRILAGAPQATAGGGEVTIALRNQSIGVFGDSLIAHTPGKAMLLTADEASSMRLVNLTLADNASGITLFSTSSNSSYVTNTLFTNAASDSSINGTVLSNNLSGVAPDFLAPSLEDYSLRRAGAAPMDAGADSAIGGIGVRDVTGAARQQGAHVDIGAYESSDRLFVDRVDR